MTIVQRSQRAFEPGAIVQEDLQTVDPVLVETNDVGDAVVETYTTASAYYNYYVYPNEGVVVTNSTPEICDISGLPYVSRVSPGRGKLYLDNGRCKIQLILGMTDSGGVGGTKIITGIKNGSLTEFLWSGIIEPMLTGTPSTRRPLFLNALTGSPSAYTLNPDRIGSGFDFSGIPVWESSSSSAKKCGALITPRHLKQTSHYHTPVGTTVKFRGSDGVITALTVVGVSSAIGDDVVVVLSDDVPETVSPYPIVGEWAFTVVSGPSDGLYAIDISSAGIWLNQNRQILPAFRLVPETSSVLQISGTLAGVAYTAYQIQVGCDSYFWPDGYLDWGLAAYGGDSGSPMFFPLSSSELAFAANISAPTAGTLLSESLANALIASADSNAGISTGYTVTVAPDPTA